MSIPIVALIPSMMDILGPAALGERDSLHTVAELQIFDLSICEPYYRMDQQSGPHLEKHLQRLYEAINLHKDETDGPRHQRCLLHEQILASEIKKSLDLRNQFIAAKPAIAVSGAGGNPGSGVCVFIVHRQFISVLLSALTCIGS